MRTETDLVKQGAVSDLPDHESFMRLWVRHQSRVYAYIRALVFRRYHDAKDAAQIRLLWSSPSTPRAIVPHSQLHPDH